MFFEVPLFFIFCEDSEKLFSWFPCFVSAKSVPPFCSAGLGFEGFFQRVLHVYVFGFRRVFSHPSSM